MAQHDTGLGWTLKDSYAHSASGIIGLFRSPSQLNNDFPLIPRGGYPAESSFIAGGKYFLMNTNQVYGTLFGSLGRFPETARNCFMYLASNTVYACFVSATSFSVSQYNLSFRDVTNHASVYNAALGQISSIYNNESGLYYYAFSIKTGYTGTLTSGTIPVYNTLQAGLNDLAGTSYSVYKLNAGEALVCIAKFHDVNGVSRTSPVIISTNADYCVLSLDNTNPATELLRISALYQGVRFTMGYFPTWGEMSVSTPYVEVADISNFPALLPKGILNAIAQPDWGNIIVTNSPDPYQQEDEESEEDGGDGEEDDAEDVDFTDPPSTSIGATGFLTIFCPSLYELQQLGQFMWSSFDVDNWRKIIANPMDAILGLHIIPVPAVITGTKSLKVAGIDTTYTMSYTTVRYIRRSMGTCDIPKKWGAYLDYNPYTKLSIFLPYIGFKELDADDVMGKTISLQYIIDILTGACVAELKCGDTVLYSWSGNCANEVPISSSDWRGAISAAVGIAATIAATAAVTGGATAPMAASMVASVGANSMNLKPTINRSGAIAGSSGFIGQQRPYIIRTIPNLVIPADQNKFIGYPSFVNLSLGSLTGYNEISSVHLEGIPATGAELDELESILKGGVIF